MFLVFFICFFYFEITQADQLDHGSIPLPARRDLIELLDGGLELLIGLANDLRGLLNDEPQHLQTIGLARCRRQKSADEVNVRRESLDKLLAALPALAHHNLKVPLVYLMRADT